MCEFVVPSLDSMVDLGLHFTSRYVFGSSKLFPYSQPSINIVAFLVFFSPLNSYRGV